MVLSLSPSQLCHFSFTLRVQNSDKLLPAIGASQPSLPYAASVHAQHWCLSSLLTARAGTHFTILWRIESRVEQNRDGGFGLPVWSSNIQQFHGVNTRLLLLPTTFKFLTAVTFDAVSSQSCLWWMFEEPYSWLDMTSIVGKTESIIVTSSG